MHKKKPKTVKRDGKYVLDNQTGGGKDLTAHCSGATDH